MEFRIKNTEVFGYERAVKSSGNPMRTVIETSPIDEKDIKRAINLGTTKGGEGHDNFLKGIIVQLDLTAPLFFWKQAQRYHWFDFVSSQSTMHSLLKFDVSSQCVGSTNPRVISVIDELVAEYLAMDIDNKERATKWREIIASLPSGFCLSATMTTNYQQLKTMYFQRKHHKLEEWISFCSWCETLPHFLELVRKD